MMRERGGPLTSYYGNRNSPRDASFGDNAQQLQQRPQQQLQQRPRLIQGGSRRSYSAHGPASTAVHLSAASGRPLDARVQWWDGPGNASHDVRVWSEDGTGRDMEMEMERPDRWGGGSGRGGEHYRNGSVDVANRGPMEHPLRAGVGSSGPPPRRERQQLDAHGAARGGYNGGGGGGEKIQGGTVRHFTLDPAVSSVRVVLESDGGMPLKALVELLQGPGRVAQLAQVSNQHGRPFAATLPTPGYGSTVAVRNEGPMEYPFRASVVPASMEAAAAVAMEAMVPWEAPTGTIMGTTT